MTAPDQNAIDNEARQRQIAEKAKWIHDEYKARQRTLAAQTMGKKVHDIVQFPDDNADDILIWVYIDAKLSEFKPNSQAVVMIVISEPGSQRVIFDQVTVKKNRYWTADGQNLVKSLVDQSYDYRS